MAERDQSSSMVPGAATGKVGQQAGAATHEDGTKEIGGQNEELSEAHAESSMQTSSKKKVASRRNRKNSELSQKTQPKGKLVVRSYLLGDSLSTLPLLIF